MAREVAQRYPSMEALAQELTAWLKSTRAGDQPVEAAPPLAPAPAAFGCGPRRSLVVSS